MDLTNDEEDETMGRVSKIKTITTFHPFRCHLDGSKIESQYATLSDFVRESLGRLLGQDVSLDQLIKICDVMLDSEKLKTLQELIGDFTLDTILPTLKHRTCIHGSILNWFLEWYFGAVGVKFEIEATHLPTYSPNDSDSSLAPVIMGANKDQIVILGGTLTDYIGRTNWSESDLRNMLAIMGRADLENRVALLLQHQDMHFCGGVLDMRGENASFSIQNSLGSCFPDGLKGRMQAFVNKRGKTMKFVETKNVAEQRSLECGPRSVLSICNSAQIISFAPEGDVHRLAGDQCKGSPGRAKRKCADSGAGDTESVRINDQSDWLRTFMTLSALKCYSCIPGSKYEFESGA
jgi:hypothetical protein